MMKRYDPIIGERIAPGPGMTVEHGVPMMEEAEDGGYCRVEDVEKLVRALRDSPAPMEGYYDDPLLLAAEYETWYLNARAEALGEE